MSSAVAGHLCAHQSGCHTIRQWVLWPIEILTFGTSHRFMLRSYQFDIGVGSERPWIWWGSIHICLRLWSARLFVFVHSLIKKTDLLNCTTLIWFNCVLIEKRYGPITNLRWLSADPIRGLSVGKRTGHWNQRKKKKGYIMINSLPSYKTQFSSWLWKKGAWIRSSTRTCYPVFAAHHYNVEWRCLWFHDILIPVFS